MSERPVIVRNVHIAIEVGFFLCGDIFINSKCVLSSINFFKSHGRHFLFAGFRELGTEY
jgi:hypothetical protein